MFNERGFSTTSLDDVAASLGVTRPVVYHYLGNKDQVLFECVRLGVAQLEAAAASARASEGNGRDRLRRFLLRYAEVIMSDFGRCVVRTGDECLSPESATEFRALKRRIDNAMRDLVSEGVADGSLVAPDIRMTTFVLAGALNWIGRWHNPDGALNNQEIAIGLVDPLMQGLIPR